MKTDGPLKLNKVCVKVNWHLSSLTNQMQFILFVVAKAIKTVASQQIACVAGGIRGRDKVLVYERRSREENGEERL